VAGSYKQDNEPSCSLNGEGFPYELSVGYY
jgi:hypothetical protein